MKIPKYVEQSHEVFWPQFTNWCGHNGLATDVDEDMETWWSCFIAGATTMYLKVKTKEIDV